MPVAKGVDVEDVDGGGHAEEVGPRGGGKVPGVEVEKTADKVGSVGGGEGEEDKAGGGGEERLDEAAGTIVEVEVDVAAAKGLRDEVERVDQNVQLHHGEVTKGEDVRHLRTVVVSLVRR